MFIVKISVLLAFVLLFLFGASKTGLLSKKVADNTPATPKYTLPQTRTYDNQIALPKPKTSGGLAVETAIQQRRSRREFSTEPVAMSELSQLLWAAQGITDPETGHRTAPSARESYPFTMFVVVKNVAGLNPGLYEYLPKEHALGVMNLSNAGELLNSAGVQPGAQSAPVDFVLAASYGTAEKILGETAVSSSLLEAGHIGQNMYLQTESLQMAMVVMGGFDAKKVGTALSLDPAESVVYLMPFGHRSTTPAKEVLGVTSDATHLFTTEELAQYDGKDGHKTYFAFKGKVYDVTGSDKWKNGEHYSLFAGKDLTGMLGEAPHGEEVLTKFPVVGTFAYTETTSGPIITKSQFYILLGGVGFIALTLVLFGTNLKKSSSNKKKS